MIMTQLGTQYLYLEVVNEFIRLQLQKTNKHNNFNITQFHLSWLDARLLMYDDGPDDSFWASNSKRSTEEFARDGAVGGEIDKSLRWLHDARSSPVLALGFLNSTHDSSSHTSN